MDASSTSHLCYNRKMGKDKIKMRQYSRNWWAKRAKEFHETLDKLKDGPCIDCNNRFNPWQMDFDHRPGEEKEFSISDGLKSKDCIAKLHAEVAKCDLVCANCHRDRTHGRLAESGLSR